jgi:hypothetical protein
MAKIRYLVTCIQDWSDESVRRKVDPNLYMVVNGRAFKIRLELPGYNQVLSTDRVTSIPLYKIPTHPYSPSITTHWFEYSGPTHDAEGKKLDTAQLLVWKYTVNGAFVPDFVFKEVSLKRLTY